AARIVKGSPLDRRVSNPAVRHRAIAQPCPIDLIFPAIEYRDTRDFENLRYPVSNLACRGRILVQEHQRTAEFIKPLHFLLPAHGFECSFFNSGGELTRYQRRY